MARWSLLCCAVALLFSFSLLAEARVIPTGPETIQQFTECLRSKGQFSKFLSYFEGSGFSAVFARYLSQQPCTIFVPTNEAFNRLPLRVQNQLKGARLIKVIEQGLLLQKFPSAYLQHALPGAFFDTVLGSPMYKIKTASRKSLVFSSTKSPKKSSLLAVVENPDVCGASSMPLVCPGCQQCYFARWLVYCDALNAR